MRRILLATLVLTLSACEGSPFNPYGNVKQDWCHPEKWLNEEERALLPAALADSLDAYQKACSQGRRQ